jgi:D-3-phosphoglycerate dehydrogenase
MRILANDGMDAQAVQTLTSLGYEVDTTHYQNEDLLAQLAQVDCIVIRSATKLRQPHIDAAVAGGQLKLIIRAGVGIDNIDHVYAESKGILVRNTPNSSSDAVAELAIGHMFAIARHIYHANVTMRQGLWNKKQYKGIELAGKTLGLIGFGRIAKAVARRAIALGMDVIYTDLSGCDETDTTCRFVDKDELLASADFLSLHIPFRKEDGPYLGKDEFAKMKRGMYLIHTARGGVVDEAALLQALDDGIVAYAALDVFEDEPTRHEAIYTHDRISLTPHIGASTVEAQARIGQETIQVIQDILS